MKANDYLPNANKTTCTASAAAQTAQEFPFTYTYYGFGAPAGNTCSSSHTSSKPESSHDAA